MTDILAQFSNAQITLPQCMEFEGNSQNGDICIRFLRHLQVTKAQQLDHKILSAIHFTADILGHSDMHVAKVLTDLGLRAPRSAYPSDYLNFAYEALSRSVWQSGSARQPLQDLALHWINLGDEIPQPCTAPAVNIITHHDQTNEEIKYNS